MILVSLKLLLKITLTLTSHQVKVFSKGEVLQGFFFRNAFLTKGFTLFCANDCLPYMCRMETVNKCFSHDTVEEIINALVILKHFTCLQFLVTIS